MDQVGDGVGVVGLGAMGGPVARHVAAQGFSVPEYDRDPEVSRSLSGDGVDPVGTPGALRTIRPHGVGRQKSESELAARAEFDRKHPDRVQPGSLSREEARRLLDAAVAARTDGSST